MVGTGSAGQELGTEELEVVGDGKDFGFGEEVVGGGILEGSVLDSLEFGNIGGGGNRKPNRGSICENRTNEGFVGLEHSLLLVSPGCAS